MFGGGYGGNRIKCRIVHHDPVLSFGFDFGLGLGIHFGVSASRNLSRAAHPTVAGMPQGEAKTELSTSALDLKSLQFSRKLA